MKARGTEIQQLPHQAPLARIPTWQNPGNRPAGKPAAVGPGRAGVHFGTRMEGLFRMMLIGSGLRLVITAIGPK